MNSKSRVKAATIHLVLSAVVALVVGLLILRLWFPGPWATLAGGQELFWIVLGVDIALGPLITLFVFNSQKSRTELGRDLTVIAVLQVLALGYGMYTVYQARPAILALEIDRIRAVKPIELDAPDLIKAPEGLRMLKAFGILKAAARKAANEKEQMESLDLALQGRDIGARPEMWLPTNQTNDAWAKAAKPIADLRERKPESVAEIERAVKASGMEESKIGFLPIIARHSSHSALVDKQTGEIRGYVEVDGF